MVTIVFAAGDALGDALVRPGRVVVHLVFGQDGAQVALPEDQHAVQELTAQGTDEASQIAFFLDLCRSNTRLCRSPALSPAGLTP